MDSLGFLLSQRIIFCHGLDIRVPERLIIKVHESQLVVDNAAAVLHNSGLNICSVISRIYHLYDVFFFVCIKAMGIVYIQLCIIFIVKFYSLFWRLYVRSRSWSILLSSSIMRKLSYLGLLNIQTLSIFCICLLIFKIPFSKLISSQVSANASPRRRPQR